MSVNKSRAALLSALLLLSGLMGAGCGNKSGGGVGDTVPTPPRALVEQSFHPPTNVARPEATHPKH